MLHFLLGFKMHLGCNTFTTTEILQSFQLSQAHVVQVLSNRLLLCARKCLNQTKGEKTLGSTTNTPNEPVIKTPINWDSKAFHFQYGLVHTII